MTAPPELLKVIEQAKEQYAAAWTAMHLSGETGTITAYVGIQNVQLEVSPQRELPGINVEQAKEQYATALTAMLLAGETGTITARVGIQNVPLEVRPKRKLPGINVERGRWKALRTMYK